MKKTFFALTIIGILSAIIVAYAGDYGKTQKQTFIAEEVALAERIVQLRSDFMAHRQKWNSRGYGSGGANEIVLADYAGTQYEGLTIAQITAGQTSMDSFETWIDAGHDDNFVTLTQ